MARWKIGRLPLTLQTKTAAHAFAGYLVPKMVTRSLDHLAEANKRRGVAMLGEGTRVLTDRLHGHILCELMSIPHIVVDNGIGKLRAFYESWTSNSEVACWSDSPEEALEILRSSF